MTERQKTPLHPGRIIREHHLEPLSISIADLARTLLVSRKTVSKIVNGKSAVSPDMALRLSRALNTSPKLWLGLQMEYDLWRAQGASRAWKQVKQVRASQPDRQTF